ncbi:fructosamine kinase family protein [Streptomyces sp. NPDC005438]|uniref:fructosamine kinase family protein n=1 Tax=Streptomyces sp. NPDC005438 TaxID=3156880 RepID=UPI0033A6D883
MTWLRQRVGDLLGQPVEESRPVGGGSICDAHRLRLADGRTVFAKTLDRAPADFFRTEADGLRLLGRLVEVPEVWAVEDELLVLEWVEPGPADPAQAERLGRRLAALHQRPVDHFGAASASDGTPHRAGYLASLPLAAPDVPIGDPGRWGAFHAEYRLLPLLRAAVDRGALGPADAAVVERLCERLGDLADPQPPRLIHGDLWAGNVHWAADGRARLIDPSAQGGHPEADLAMLELFGCPALDHLLGAYQEVRPTPGRAARVPLHQLHPLLAHAVLFGGGYGARSAAAARAALSALGA